MKSDTLCLSAFLPIDTALTLLSSFQIMLLLSAIALFSPDSPNVVHRDVVKLEQVSENTTNWSKF